MKNFMDLAKTVAQNSKDPSSKVGCVIVDEDKRLVSTGYNGMVAGCDEDHMTWDRPMKYHLVIHAEANALLYARRNLKGCIAYITHSPCESCLKLLLQAGIKRIYYGCPSIMRERSTIEQKEAIARLLAGSMATVENLYTEQDYRIELDLYTLYDFTSKQRYEP
jgi:dCMP deaminase